MSLNVCSRPSRPFSFRPKHFVIVDDAVGIPPGLSAVANDLSGDLAIWINPEIKGPKNQCRRQMVPDLVVLGSAEVLRDLERENAAVVIMPEDQIVRNIQTMTEKFLGLGDSRVRKIQRLPVGKIERSRVIDREIVTDLILRERGAISIGDLSARRRNIKDVGSSHFCVSNVGTIVSSNGAGVLSGVGCNVCPSAAQRQEYAQEQHIAAV